MKSLYDVPAPAKLNLFLHVTGRRPDGYHLLQSVFMLIDWCDTLHFELRSDGVITRRDLTEALPPDDLVIRAARSLQSFSQCIARAMLRFAFSTNSLFSINLLHDFVFDSSFFADATSNNNMLYHPERHRINVPGTPEDKNWSYRFPFYVEDLLANVRHMEEIRFMLEESGRIDE
jgi:hypothetical protein